MTNEIDSKVQSAIEKQDEKSLDKIMHNKIPNKFKLKDSGFKPTQSMNNNEILQSYNDYLINNNVLSFSFVRHPFER